MITDEINHCAKQSIYIKCLLYSKWQTEKAAPSLLAQRAILICDTYPEAKNLPHLNTSKLSRVVKLNF